MPKYKQFLKNVFSVSTISLKSNNFKKFLKYFPCLYSRLVSVYIWGHGLSAPTLLCFLSR